MSTATKSRRLTDVPTKRQAEAYRHIVAFVRKHGVAPTLGEICAFVGIRSLDGVKTRIQGLVRKGYLRPNGNRHRGYLPVVTHRCECCDAPMFREIEPQRKD